MQYSNNTRLKEKKIAASFYFKIVNDTKIYKTADEIIFTSTMKCLHKVNGQTVQLTSE